MFSSIWVRWTCNKNIGKVNFKIIDFTFLRTVNKWSQLNLNFDLTNYNIWRFYQNEVYFIVFEKIG